MSGRARQVRLHIDGGARGNPGPAAAGVILSSADGKRVLFQGGFFLGEATNNVAEYTALLEGLDRAVALGAEEVEVVSDSELLVRQMTGTYRVKNEALKALHEQAQALEGRLKRCAYRHVYREGNRRADDWVNKALNLKRNVGDAAKK